MDWRGSRSSRSCMEAVFSISLDANQVSGRKEGPLLADTNKTKYQNVARATCSSSRVAFSASSIISTAPLSRPHLLPTHHLSGFSCTGGLEVVEFQSGHASRTSPGLSHVVTIPPTGCRRRLILDSFAMSVFAFLTWYLTSCLRKPGASPAHSTLFENTRPAYWGPRLAVDA